VTDLVVRPIGFVRSPFAEKVAAPHQPSAPSAAHGTVEVLAAYRDALADLEDFDRIWLLFWFDRNTSDPPMKVLPPRSEVKRGVFATRSPHRPNPLGMSAVRLECIEGLVLHVRDLDLVDGTPVIDIKPYLPYADAFPDAAAGWLEAHDPRAPWSVTCEPVADEALMWIHRESGFDLGERTRSVLRLGPQPHAYRRIKPTADGKYVLAVKAWRARFRVDRTARLVVVEQIATGYRTRDLAEGQEPAHALHRAFQARFG
jgi:tRNA-Thr(GGU) m(6)t(6)A37 methyltransferase TsaA